jgi:hypothetical protein
MVGTTINDMADNCTNMINPPDFLYLPALMSLIEARLGPNLALERGCGGTTVDAQARQWPHKSCGFPSENALELVGRWQSYSAYCKRLGSRLWRSSSRRLSC